MTTNTENGFSSPSVILHSKFLKDGKKRRRGEEGGREEEEEEISTVSWVEGGQGRGGEQEGRFSRKKIGKIDSVFEFSFLFCVGRYGKLMCTHSVLFLATGKKGRVWQQVTEQQSRKARLKVSCGGRRPTDMHCSQRRPWYANRAPNRVFGVGVGVGVGGGGNKCAKLGRCRAQRQKKRETERKKTKEDQRKIVHRFLPPQKKKLGPPSDSLTPKATTTAIIARHTLKRSV